MEKTLTKVKSVQANGTFESQYGMLYKFDYELEDGTVLSANHKSQSPFPQGSDVEYEIKGQNEYGKWGSVSKPQQNFSNPPKGKQNGNVSSFALAYAKDFAGFHIAKGIDYTPEQILQTATKFNEWLKTN